MNIVAYNNSSDPRIISKSVTQVTEFVGTLRNETEVVNPVILVEGAIPTFNYCFIAAFNRYYFVTDIKTVRNNVYEIHLKSDVLMSFPLNGITGIVTESESVGADVYLEARNWISKVKDKTDIITFPSGLSDQGNYILITSGGIYAG